MDPLYREIILDNWQNPQNCGVLKDADIDVTETNPLCGDAIRLTITFKNRKVRNVLFSGEGCAISQASASLFTEKMKEMSIQTLRNVTDSEILQLLGIDLTPARIKCALLILKTLQKGLVNTDSISK